MGGSHLLTSVSWRRMTDSESSIYNVVSSFLLDTPVYPFLWIPHCCMTSLALRASLGHGDKSRKFGVAHPLTCFLLSILYTYPGGLFSLLLLCKPLLTFLTWSNQLYSSTVIWYLMFFAPLDLPYRILTTVPLVTTVFAASQDWLRIGLVVSSVNTVMESHPDCFLYPVVFATVKSSGFVLVKYLEQVVLHGWEKGPFVLPHHSTKTMILSACLLSAHKLGHLPWIGKQAELHVILIILAVSIRLITTMLYQNWDPYSAMEDTACRIIYGREDLPPPVSDDKKGKKKD